MKTSRVLAFTLSVLTAVSSTQAVAAGVPQDEAPATASPSLETRVVAPATQKSSLHVELLGRNILYSIGLDVPLTSRTSVGVSGTYVAGEDEWAQYSTTIVTPSITVYSGERHRLFATGAVLLGYGSTTSNSTVYSYSNNTWTTSRGESHHYEGFGWIPQVGGGYEFRSTGGFIFRTSLYLNYVRNEIFSDSSAFLPWLGLSFGTTL